MAQLGRVADSNESESDPGESLNAQNLDTPVTKLNRKPESVLAHRDGEANGNMDEDADDDGNDQVDEDEDEPEEADEDEDEEADADADNTIVVMVPGPKNPEEYVPYQEDDTVNAVLEELTGSDGETLYKVEYGDEREENITFNRLLHLPNGNNALDIFNNRDSDSIVVDNPSNSSRSMSSRAGKRPRRQPTNNNFVDISNVQLSSDDDRSTKNGKKKRRLVNNMSTIEIEKARRSTRFGSRQPSRPIFDNDDDDEDVNDPQSGTVRSNGDRPRRSGRAATRSAAPRKANTLASYVEEDEDELAGDLQVESEGSDIAYAKPKRRRASNARTAPSKPNKRGRTQARGNRSDDSSEWSRERPSRISGRGNKTGKSMKERDVDEEIYADEVAGKSTPKVISIREIYQPVSVNSPFGLIHDQDCDVCGGTGKNSNKGRSDLVYCQGCSSSIHKLCLGYRAGREHMVTKVGHEHFVMQCRRCIGLAAKKDPLAPRLGACSSCNEPGPSCAAFSVKKTAKQEEKLREENNGDDPITRVRDDLINNPNNVLFRCRGCQRGFHFEHLPPRSKKSTTPQNADDLRSQRIQEYTKSWQCKQCYQSTTKLQTLVAWRPSDRKSYNEGDDFDTFREDEKEYLVKWDDKSYFQCSWMPGAWVWGVAAASMRKAFIRRDEGANMSPKWTKEEAISEEYLRMEIIFDVEYDESFQPKSEEYDKAHINDVVQVLVKFRGLTYDESVWEEPPSPNEADRWSDFVSAYNEYVMGKYFKQSPASAVKERIDAFRSLNFEKKVVLKKQPDSLIGGEMMKHQMEGLNWLLFNFHRQKNVILADEMGLGKTIQVIALIASLVKDKPKCSPFLVVTPNSTCPNWRREIKKWAPGLRVVAYYGAKSARDMAMNYEMYPNGCSDLRADIVVTSYEAPVDDSSRAFFKKVKWAGMIVDEGQRLKNDGNLLYGALTALKIPFQVLLSGTPLQNNKRELFNLLQFLDDSIDAAELDEKYAELTKENLPELHELIRPFFLRRTKLQVLKFLPPMSQTIIPVSMSVVQKQLYKSILAKNPELIKSIIGKTNKALRPTERGNLNNILMQLRKCLCHPFLYSSAIEETSLSHEALHRNLIDASSKFQLLEIMLPKLQARGHRVLIFSQFLKQLDLVEDFLNGLELPFQRLDGTVSTLEKQKRIDAFNAPNSKLFAFLLSTRAGGVGINLATADTVIIMDPDFNPHQDIQALSRAHRIGQKKKVLVFQLVTKGSAEEQIVQVGRKKMALDQALIESIDVKDDAGDNLEAILRHGAEAVLLDDDSKDVYYDPASVDELLDRSQVENTTNDDETAESQFSHARVWIKDKGDLSEDFGETEAEPAAPKALLWDAILKQRATDAALEAAKNMQTFGRGKRARQTVDYEKSQPELMELDGPDGSPRRDGRRTRRSHSDDEFAGHGAKESEAEESDAYEDVDPRELETGQPRVKVDNSTGDRQGPPVAIQKIFRDYEKWRQVSINNECVFPSTRQLQEWLDQGHELLENCTRHVQELEQPNQMQADVERQYRYLQERIRGVLDQPQWWYNQEEQKPQEFWQAVTPQLVQDRHQLHRDTAQWVQARDQLVRPWGNHDADYSLQLHNYEQQSEEWLDQGDKLIEGHNRLKQFCEREVERREDPKSRYRMLRNEVRGLRQACDSERKIREELVRPRGVNPWGNGREERNIQEQYLAEGMSAAQEPRTGTTNPLIVSNAVKNPGSKNSLFGREKVGWEEELGNSGIQQQEQGTNGGTRKRGPYKKRKAAENQAVDSSFRDQLVQAGVPLIRELEEYFEWLANNPLVLPVNKNDEHYYEQLEEYERQIGKRVQKSKQFEDAFDEQFRVQRPRDAERARYDLAYKKRKIAERKSGEKYIPIEDHAPRIQELDRQLRDNMERQQQARYYAIQLRYVEEHARLARNHQKAGYPEIAPEYAQPLPQGTPSKVLKEHLHRMALPLSDPRFPPPLPEETSKMSMPFGERSGQHARDPIQIDSDSNLSKKSSPVIRSIPAIEIPVKRKRGRPPGSTSSLNSSMTPVPTIAGYMPSRLTSSPSLAPISSGSSRPNVHFCPNCNFALSKLVPLCPCSAPTAKIRLMLDNLKGIKDYSEQVGLAHKVLKEALASRSAPQTFSRQ
ncbi:hypothetical protein EAF04_005728 [Stromatinia cepivora]|nr:hypothetical protein EAF04_005728 [Stromatinia cepivora]